MHCPVTPLTIHTSFISIELHLRLSTEPKRIEFIYSGLGHSAVLLVSDCLPQSRRMDRNDGHLMRTTEAEQGVMSQCLRPSHRLQSRRCARRSHGST